MTITTETEFAYRVGGGWGYHISWSSEPTMTALRVGLLRRKRAVMRRRFYGHGKYPQVGDSIVHIGDDGPGNLWRVIEVQRESNPDDMVQGTVEFVRRIEAGDPVLGLHERGWGSDLV